MVPAKVKLQWIADDSSRRVTFNKRKKGIVKKVSELSTLCDVKACMILYGHGKPHPEVIWPSVPEAVTVLSTLGELSETEWSKKMMDLKGFMHQRIKKSKEQLHKQGKENRVLEMEPLLYQCLTAGRSVFDTTSMEDLTDLSQLVEFKIRLLQRRIEGLSAGNHREVIEISEVDEQLKTPSEAMQQEVIETTTAATKVVEGEKQPVEEAILEVQQSQQQQQQQQFPGLGLMSSGQQMASGRQIMIHPYAGDDTNQWMAMAYYSGYFVWTPYYYPMN